MDDYAMLPPRALGFALDSKRWGQFLIDGIQPDTKDTYDVFEKELVFPEGKDDKNKDVLKDLITSHGNQSFSRITDFVGGKGQGLVLLFHGLASYRQFIANCRADLTIKGPLALVRQ